MVSCLPRPFFHLYLSHFHIYLLCSCVTLKPDFHTTFHPLTSSSHLLLLSFYSVFLIAGLCPGLFLGVSALIKHPSAQISLQPEPTCIFLSIAQLRLQASSYFLFVFTQLLNSDCSLSVPLSYWSSVPPSSNRLWAPGSSATSNTSSSHPAPKSLNICHPSKILSL